MVTLIDTLTKKPSELRHPEKSPQHLEISCFMDRDNQVMLPQRFNPINSRPTFGKFGQPHTPDRHANQIF